MIFYRNKKGNNKNHYLLQSLNRKSRRSKNKRKRKCMREAKDKQTCRAADASGKTKATNKNQKT